MGIALERQDEPHRTCVQLYHHVTTQADLFETFSYRSHRFAKA